MKKFLSVLLIAVMLMASLTACGTKEEGTAAASAQTKEATNAAKDWNVCIIAIGSDPQTMDPAVNSAFQSVYVRRNVYEPLFQFDDEYNICPCIADTWEFTDDTHLKVHINENAKFSNGDPVTSEDVMFMLEHSVGTSADTYTTSIDKEATYAAVIDDHNFVIVTKEPSANQINMLCNGLCGIFSKKDFDAKGGDFTKGIAGSGPYVYDSCIAGDTYTLKKNENYWNDASCPNRIGELRFRVIPEGSTRANELDVGGCDVVIGINTADVDRIKNNDKLTYHTVYTSNAQYLFMNTAHAPLDNQKVREAIRCALDRPAMVEVGFGDLGALNNNFCAIGIQGNYDCSEFLGERDVEKAKQLLAEAGYPDGVTVTAVAPSNNSARMDVTVAVQAQLAEAGITVELNSMDGNAAMVALESGEHDIAIYGLSAASGEAGGTLVRFLPETATYNLSTYPEDDELVDYIRQGLASASDTAKRDEWYAKAQKRINELCLCVPFYSTAVNAATSNVIDPETFHMEGSFQIHRFWEMEWAK